MARSASWRSFGLLCRPGCSVAVEVFAGNTGDPSTLASQVNKLKERFTLERVVLIGDRGMITQARLEETVKPGARLDHRPASARDAGPRRGARSSSRCLTSATWLRSRRPTIQHLVARPVIVRDCRLSRFGIHIRDRGKVREHHTHANIRALRLKPSSICSEAKMDRESSLNLIEPPSKPVVADGVSVAVEPGNQPAVLLRQRAPLRTPETPPFR
jgi:hypothetical protein